MYNVGYMYIKCGTCSYYASIFYTAVPILYRNYNLCTNYCTIVIFSIKYLIYHKLGNSNNRYPSVPLYIIVNKP